MKPEYISLLVILAKKTGLHSKAMLSTQEIAGLAGYSQQSISRKLRELEDEKLIERLPSTQGTSVAITERGKEELNSLYAELRDLFAKKKTVLKGKLVDGLGEGAYYTQIPQYKAQFRELFGLDIFPGTLNLEVDPHERNVFTSSPAAKVNGFQDKDRTFGGINCWPCTVKGKGKGIAIIPHRTNHPKNIIEIVADYSIRKKFNLKNGQIVELERL